MNPIALLLALLVHALVLVPIEVEHRKEPTKPAQITLSGWADMKFRPEGDGTGLACDDTYRGVGLRFAWGGSITEIAPGGPAARAGIQVGDVLLNPFEGEEPDHIVLQIERDGHRRTLRLAREVICQDKA